jgi:predicted Rossmann fold flavoprotein
MDIKNEGEMKRNSVIVVGAGAAGMLAAITAAENGASVVLMEKNKRPGRKLMITGKGRCNITNNCSVVDFISSVPANGRFLFSAISRFTPQDTMALFESMGLRLKTERGNRVFPMSDKAADVVDTLNNRIKRVCKFINSSVESLIIEGNAVKGVLTNDGESLYAGAVILATGGLSYTLTGSTGDGYKMAAAAGHRIIDLKPSLVPITSNDSFCKDLQGLALKNVEVKLFQDGKSKAVYKDFGEMLFTHFGISGPVVLSASAHIKGLFGNKYRLVIDLKPALSEEQLDKRIQTDFRKNINKDISNSLFELLPRKLVPVIIKLSGIDPRAKCNEITRKQRRDLLLAIKNLTVSISGFRPLEEAVITSGGVDVKEINPKTMESKIIDGLFFAGEVIDVDAYTGGFNLQIAFSTGCLAGESAAKK